MTDETRPEDQSERRAASETKGHEPPIAAQRGEDRDVAAGHEPARLQGGQEASETRGHQPPQDNIELGHPPAEGVVIVQHVGEMHQPAQDAPPPTAAPPKPADAAQSVTPPQTQQERAPSVPDAQNDSGVRRQALAHEVSSELRT